MDGKLKHAAAAFDHSVHGLAVDTKIDHTVKISGADSLDQFRPQSDAKAKFLVLWEY
ncbi:MAG: hypothetical protein ABSC15_20550 [Terriglobales bacterium]